MLSESNRGAFHSNKEWLQSVLKVQTISIKAMHDYFEEQNFYHILPVLLSRLVYSTTRQDHQTDLKVNYRGQNLRLNQLMTMHMQIALGKGLEKIYTIAPKLQLNFPSQSKYPDHTLEYNQLKCEMIDADMDRMLRMVEELLRRIKVDLESKAGPELVHFDRSFEMWEDHFPVYYSHDLDVDFGDNWKIEASLEHETPFWVICDNEHFFDLQDPSLKGDHYLNYSLHYPQGFGEAARGSQREYRYNELMSQMQNMDISRYNFTDYLILAQKKKLEPSAGFSLGIERLVRYLTNQAQVSDIQIFPRNPNDEIII